MTFHVRIVCYDEEGWHYYREEQETLDETITCPSHPENSTKDFVVEKETVSA